MFVHGNGSKDKSVMQVLARFARTNVIRIAFCVGLLYLCYALHCLVALHSLDSENAVQDSAEIIKKIMFEHKPHKVHDQLTDTISSEVIFHVIDKDDLVRQKRLEVLKEIYDISHPSDETYNLNESHSRTIDLERDAPDYRPGRCRSVEYDRKHLPTISVIIPIYQEALSLVLRAVHSFLKYTPAILLKEIVLVDDCSKNENLKEPLDKYMEFFPAKVKVVRNLKRNGLIRSRMIGAAQTTGDVLLFQDAHTEVSTGWAEPILDYIQRYPNAVIQPMVEELRAGDIQWAQRGFDGSLWRGVFMWDMRFAWNLIPPRYSSWYLSEIEPYPNAVLVGCSLAVHREFFYHLGGFDQGLNVWGGENIELSFKSWMCGGMVVIHPCSRIAHVFKPFSYSFDGDKEKIVGKNNIRVVETWMGPYRDYFYASNYIYDFKIVELNEEEKQSLKVYKEFKENLHCKSFEWYLNNILPEMARPAKNVQAFGEIQNIISKYCFEVMDDGYIVMTLDCYTYSRMKDDQEFALTDTGRLLFFDQCVSITDQLLLRVLPCGDSSNQIGWMFEIVPRFGQVVGILRYTLPNQSTLCLQQVTNIADVHIGKQVPQLLECREDETWQIWYISYRFNYSLVPPPPV